MAGASFGEMGKTGVGRGGRGETAHKLEMMILHDTRMTQTSFYWFSISHVRKGQIDFYFER